MPTDISQFPFASGAIPNTSAAWNGTKTEGGGVLFWNQDLNNTVALAYRASAKQGDLNTIPIPPNGMITLDGTRTVYAFAPAGTANLVIIPGGASFFRSITQAVGSLVLPSVHSPNFVSGSSGWTINKDGSVEFNNGTFRGNIVGGALYIYSGAGSLGNPPQLAIVPPGTVNDPFGNAVTSSKILMQGNIITESGGIFRTNGSAPLIQLDGPHDAVFIYDASARLTQSLTPVATNDGLGHTVYAGIVNYNTSVNAIAQLLNGFLNVGTPNQIGAVGGAAPGFAGLASAGNPGVFRIDSGLTATGDTDAFLDVRSNNAQGAINAISQRNLRCAGPIALSVETPTVTQLDAGLLYDDGTGYAHTKSANSGDTNNFIVGHLCTFNPNDQLINSLTFANILNSLTPLGVGKYRITARITAVQGPNIIANGFRIGWTGTITQVRARLRQIQDNTSAFLATTTSNNGLLATHAWGAATTYDAELTAIINTSSTGNISIQAACQTNAANTFTVLAASDFYIEPI